MTLSVNQDLLASRINVQVFVTFLELAESMHFAIILETQKHVVANQDIQETQLLDAQKFCLASLNMIVHRENSVTEEFVFVSFGILIRIAVRVRALI